MSGVLKGIGKVFKKIVKIGKVVLPIALAAAAVVFTGGAALGILPTFAGAISGLVGGLGLSAGLAGALTGSIVSAGFGGAAGFVLSGGKMKGLQSGALAGAVTGGALGLASPSMFNIGSTGASSYVRGGAAAVGAGGGGGGNGILPGADTLGVNSIGPGIDTGVGGVAAAPAAAAPMVAAPATTAVTSAAAANGGNGIMSGFLSNPTNTMVAGNVLQGLFSPSEASQAAKLRATEGERLFSDIYSSGEANAGTADYGSGRMAVRPVRRFQLNPQTLKVEELANG